MLVCMRTRSLSVKSELSSKKCLFISVVSFFSFLLAWREARENKRNQQEQEHSARAAAERVRPSMEGGRPDNLKRRSAHVATGNKGEWKGVGGEEGHAAIAHIRRSSNVMPSSKECLYLYHISCRLVSCLSLRVHYMQHLLWWPYVAIVVAS